jgi:hypothetical protein
MKLLPKDVATLLKKGRANPNVTYDEHAVIIEKSEKSSYKANIIGLALIGLKGLETAVDIHDRGLTEQVLSLTDSLKMSLVLAGQKKDLNTIIQNLSQEPFDPISLIAA